MVPISDGMVPVSELKVNHLQDIRRRHRQRRAQPGVLSERYTRADYPFAAATQQAWRVCDHQ